MLSSTMEKGPGSVGEEGESGWTQAEVFTWDYLPLMSVKNLRGVDGGDQPAEVAAKAVRE